MSEILSWKSTMSINHFPVNIGLKSNLWFECWSGYLCHQEETFRLKVLWKEIRAKGLEWPAGRLLEQKSIGLKNTIVKYKSLK